MRTATTTFTAQVESGLTLLGKCASSIECIDISLPLDQKDQSSSQSVASSLSGHVGARNNKLGHAHAQKAMASGMLSDDEGRKVLAIVQLAEPGESEAALDDHLTHKELLTFSSLVSSWRNVKSLRGEV